MQDLNRFQFRLCNSAPGGRLSGFSAEANFRRIVLSQVAFRALLGRLTLSPVSFVLSPILSEYHGILQILVRFGFKNSGPVFSNFSFGNLGQSGDVLWLCSIDLIPGAPRWVTLTHPRVDGNRFEFFRPEQRTKSRGRFQSSLEWSDFFGKNSLENEASRIMVQRMLSPYKISEASNKFFRIIQFVEAGELTEWHRGMSFFNPWLPWFPQIHCLFAGWCWVYKQTDSLTK